MTNVTNSFYLIIVESQKAEPSSQLDISRAIKMPPMPGQSRSLLQFNQIKQVRDLVSFIQVISFLPFNWYQTGVRQSVLYKLSHCYHLMLILQVTGVT